MKKSKGYYKEKWKLMPKHTKVFLIAMSCFILLALVLLLILSFVDFRNGRAVFSGYFTFWNYVANEGWALIFVLLLILAMLGFMYWSFIKNGGVGK